MLKESDSGGEGEIRMAPRVLALVTRRRPCGAGERGRHEMLGFRRVKSEMPLDIQGKMLRRQLDINNKDNDRENHK